MVLGRSPYTLLVDMWMNGRLRAMPPRGLEQVQRADGVHVEVVEGNAGGQVVRGLGGGVDDDGRLEAFRPASARRRGREYPARGAEAGERRLQPLPGSSGCCPAGRRRPRAGYCPRRGPRSRDRGRTAATSEPIKPDEPVTRHSLLIAATQSLPSARKSRSFSRGKMAPMLEWDGVLQNGIGYAVLQPIQI